MSTYEILFHFFLSFHRLQINKTIISCSPECQIQVGRHWNYPLNAVLYSIPLNLPHLSYLVISYISQNASQRRSGEKLQSAAGFPSKEGKTVMARDFPADPDSKPQLLLLLHCMLVFFLLLWVYKLASVASSTVDFSLS